MSRNRIMEASYLDTGDGQTAAYALMGTGFTALNEEPSAQVGTKKYINNKSATNSIKGYEWKAPFEAEQIKEEAAVKFIMDIGKQQKTGPDAEADYVIVDLDEAVTGSDNTFNARKFKVAIEVASFGEDDGDMNMSGNLLGIGDPIPGTFNVSTKIFTATADVTE